MGIQNLLSLVIEKEASDLHLIVGSPPMLRIDGKLIPFPGQEPLSEEENSELIFSFMTPQQKEILKQNREVDFSLEFSAFGRFRVNTYYQRGTVTSALRLIPFKIKTIEELNLPKILHEFTRLKQGFILITGPTGHGKTTTQAAMINEINKTREGHIVTIEDPVEYIYPKGKSIVSQRELHGDTYSWDAALRSVLREDPDVVLIGEMRDLETIASALTIAETGHLVFATLHTNSAAQTVDRIVDVFPEHSKGQIKIQLANTLEAIISQRLLPMVGGGRIPVCEILISTPAVRTTIREGKSYLLDNIIQTSAELGMSTLEMALMKLIKEGKITLDSARDFSLRPEELMRLMRERK